MLPPNALEFGYEQTLITGHYRQRLRDYAKEVAEQAKIRSAIRKKKTAEEKNARRYESSRTYRVALSVKQSLRRLMRFVGEDWILLIIIGTLVGVISFTMDYAAGQAYLGRLYAFDAAESSVWLQYAVWAAYPVGFVAFAAGVVHLVNPQTAGTGMPELKAILGGIELRGFLSWRSMVAKYIAGTAAMCSGMPLVKGGILACIASCITHLLCKRFEMFKGIYENESRKLEMLAAAVAVAIACTFSSPVSGVLFCIELTATFFEVQNYWRAFFCTVCGTTVYRFFSVLSQYELTIGAFMKTSLHLLNFPFDLTEYGVFTLLGALCGLAGAFLVFVHRRLILFVRHRKKLSKFLQNYRLLYPTIVALVVATLTFPPLLGQYSAGRLNSRIALAQLLYEKPLSSPPTDAITDLEATIRANWVHPQTGVFVTLILYFIIQFMCSAISFTLAVPFGTFTPIFALGAALGRIVGELMSSFFPHGINTGYGIYQIVPGGYAIIGAASTAGAALHVISMALLVHEMTGQVNYLLPTLWATMISNVVARSLMPSMIDSIIQMKKIPFLPVFKSASSRAHQVLAQDIMQTNLKFLSHASTYDDVKDMLIREPFVRSFPVVDAPETMLLIGSVQRNELIDELERHIKQQKRASAAVSTVEAQTAGAASQSQQEQPEQQQQQLGKVTFSSCSSTEQHKPLKAVTYNEEPEQGNSSRGNNTDVDNNNRTTSRSRKLSQDEPERGSTSSDVSSKDQVGSSQPPPAVDCVTMRKPSNGMRKPILKRTNTTTSSSDQESVSGGATEPLLSDEVQQRKSQQLSRNGSTSSRTNSISFNQQPPLLTADDLVFRPDELGSMQKKRWPPSPQKHRKSTSYVEDGAAYRLEEERLRWEEERLQDKIDMKCIEIDPAPFQLSEKTSLHKVHSLFVLLRLSQAYVTSFGRLVGIVTIKEVQTELEHPSVHEAPRPLFFRKTASATIGGGDRGMPIVMSGSS